MCFSSYMYLYFRILIYVKHHEQFEIGYGAILNTNILLSGKSKTTIWPYTVPILKTTSLAAFKFSVLN